MSHLSLRRWLNRMTRSPRRGRQCTEPANRRRSRLHVETLEGRCLPSTVSNLSDHDPGSLRDAIATTPAGGTVDFQPGLSGTITLMTGELLIDKGLTIAGPGASVITVSGNHASRVFDIAGMYTVGISGLTIADGSVTNANGGGIISSGTLTVTVSILSANSATFGTGGGIENDGGMLTVTASTLSGNSAGAGGGIFNDAGTLTVTASTLTGNSSGTGGGGIYSNFGGGVTITDSTLRGNSTSGGNYPRGGGIYNYSAPLTVIACTLSGNSASAGVSPSGGGIYDYSATLIVAASTLSDNSATAGGIYLAYGGGIYFTGGTATITASTLSGNSAKTYGGGIHNEGTMTVTNSTLRGNSAGAGGGISNGGTMTVAASILSANSATDGGGIFNGGTMTATNSTLSANSATDGGGIFNGYGGLTVTSCILTGNSAGDFGGGIANFGATLTVAASTLSANSAPEGGGIFNDASTSQTVTNSTLSANSAAEGGGIFNYFGALTVASCTLSGNSATSEAGGIYNHDGASVTTAVNTIFAGNAASSGPDLSGSLVSQGHNLIGDGTGGSGYDPTDLVGTSDNPIDPKLGPLQDNGGPTFTMALLPDSPAIDAGDPTGAPEWDQRGPGYPRVVNGKIDIGAYEHQAVAPTITCSVIESLLWPPDHQLVNVGLSVDVEPPDATLQVQVYANDSADSSDAADIGPDTLRLRAERNGDGLGRVYLIVVTATNSAGSAFDVCTVVVPHDQSADSIAQVEAEAAAAEAYYREFQTAPPGYALLGQGPTNADSKGSVSLVASIGAAFESGPVAFENTPAAPNQSPTFLTIPATDPTGNGLAGDTVAPVDNYFTLSSEEQGGGEADSRLPDPWLN
jgi:hypothetical protein